MFRLKRSLSALRHRPNGLSSSQNKSTHYTDKLIHTATNNNNWGPTSVELNELSHLTFRPRELNIICKCLSARLVSKKPVQVLKSLAVVYFLLQTGSSEFLKWLYTQKYLLRSLVEYQGNAGRSSDRLASVYSTIRQKAAEISKLLDDENQLHGKRDEFQSMRMDMKLPTPRSSLDLARSSSQSPPPPMVRKTRSLDLHNRADILRDLGPSYSNSMTLSRSATYSSRDNHRHHSSIPPPPANTSDYPPGSPTLVSNTGSKLANIVELDESDASTTTLSDYRHATRQTLRSGDRHYNIADPA